MTREGLDDIVKILDFSSSCECLGGVMLRCQTCDQELVGLTPLLATIMWLLVGWVTIWCQVNHLGI